MANELCFFVRRHTSAVPNSHVLYSSTTVVFTVNSVNVKFDFNGKAYRVVVQECSSNMVSHR
jgi:hypothetical protein